MGTAALPFHEAANIFPMIEGDAFEAFIENIRQLGQCEPIVLLDDKILDGRNRYRACCIADIPPKFVQADLGDMSPVDYVLAHNLHRRHLSESQRAMVAVAVKEIEHQAAKERQQQAGHEHGRGKPMANLPQAISRGAARDIAASKLNVSGRLVDEAAHITRNGCTELIEAAKRGDIKVSSAKRIAHLPPKEQREVLSQGAAAARQRASEISNAAKKDGGKPATAEYATKLYVSRKAYESARKAVAELTADLSKKPAITVNVELCRMKSAKLLAAMDKILGVKD